MNSSYYRVKYERLAIRRGKKRFYAIARMILTPSFTAPTGEAFKPFRSS
jgi:hypothetical protein